MSIHNENYREYLLRYLEGELSTVEKQDTERYMLAHEEAAAEWGMLKNTRMQPDNTIVFPNKARLMRKEEEVAAAPIISMRSNWRIIGSAAAAIVLFGVGLGIFTYQNQKSSGTTAGTEINKPKAGGKSKAQQTLPLLKNNNLSADKDAPATAPVVKNNKASAVVKHILEPEGKQQTAEKKEEKNIENPVKDHNYISMYPIYYPIGKIDQQQYNDISINTADNEPAQTLPLDPKANPVHRKVTKAKNQSSGILFALGGDGFMKVVNGVKQVVNIKKKTIDNKTYYALVVDAGSLHIDKTIISTDH